MLAMNPRGSVGALEGHAADDSSSQGSRKGPGSIYLNGGSISRVDVRKMSDFDDMTLETKGSYDTTTYEMKSLKKRIIHMKKKLAVAQQEAKETADLRAEVERLRIACETEKKASLNKDETINRLMKEIEVLRRKQGGAKLTASATVAAASSPTAPRRKSPPAQYQTSAKSVTVTTQSKKKWWNNL